MKNVKTHPGNMSSRQCCKFVALVQQIYNNVLKTYFIALITKLLIVIIKKHVEVLQNKSLFYSASCLWQILTAQESRSGPTIPPHLRDTHEAKELPHRRFCTPLFLNRASLSSLQYRVTHALWRYPERWPHINSEQLYLKKIDIVTEELCEGHTILRLV